MAVAVSGAGASRSWSRSLSRSRSRSRSLIDLWSSFQLSIFEYITVSGNAYADHAGTAAMDAAAFGVMGIISITPNRRTSNTGAGNLQFFGRHVPSVASWDSVAAPSQYQMRRAFETSAVSPSSRSTVPAKTPASRVLTMQYLPIILFLQWWLKS